MKKTIFPVVIGATMMGLLMNLASCEKDKGTPPTISLISAPGYISKDTTLSAGTPFLIGVNSALAEEGDVLKTMNLSLSVNGGADSTIENVNIPSAYQSVYTQTDSFTAVSTKEKFTYTVTNRDGITNSVNVTIN
ncbi:MAG TPA: hypothetical protein VG603_06365 [Chitinophagales bacterium]|nr:hypothetical protein [Chitinophagales bacterium]